MRSLNTSRDITKFSADLIGMTTKNFQDPSLTRKRRGVIGLSDIHVLQYVSSSSYNNADNEGSITDDSLLSLPVKKARVHWVVVVHSQGATFRY